MNASMSRKPDSRHPSIVWENGEFHVTLPVPGGQVIEAKWKPTTTSVVRYREVGTEEWSAGFDTPLNGCNLVGLDPDREWELEVRHKNKAGEGPPARTRLPSETTNFTLKPDKSV